MLNHQFQHELIRKYIILFGSLFNDLRIKRVDSENNLTHIIKVPITYAPKEKMLARLDNDPNIDREAAVILPRMSFEMGSPIYDADRKLNTVGSLALKDPNNPNKLLHQYNPVPYDFPFNLYIYSKNARDCTKIVEQILPYFTPAFTPTVELIPDMNFLRDIPIEYHDCSIDDTYNDKKMTERRAIIWTLHFTLKGYLFGPVVSKPIIKFANTRFICASGDYNSNTTMQDLIDNYVPLEIVTTQPGLLANGSPTTNSAASIGYSLIEIDDDYGYAVDFSGTLITE